MRQKLITLDEITWKLAEKKPNFSEWVRNQLRSERNRMETTEGMKANQAIRIQEATKMHNSELLYHLEQRSPTEIKALMSILKNGLA